MSTDWHNIQLAIHCAYHQEALPLIQALRLKRDNHVHAFALFSNDNIVLIESGQGAQLTAMAIGFVAGQLQQRNIAWLNIGIAGHANADIGRLFTAQRIIDAQSQHSHYPDPSLNQDMDPETVCSYAQANNDYQQAMLYDMEAWAFFDAALHFSSLELIQCLKIVSDNSSRPAADLDKQQVAALIQTQSDNIISVIESLRQRVQQLRSIERLPDLYHSLLSNMRFSESQKPQLQNLLRQWQQVGAPEMEPFIQQARKETLTKKNPQNSRQFLHGLEQALLRYYQAQYR